MKKTDDNLIKFQYQILINALKNLASPYDKQITSFPDFAVVTDELVNDFDDAYRLVPQLKELGLISDKAESLLVDIDKIIQEMEKQEELWGHNGLRNSPLWEECRRIAQVILIELNKIEREMKNR